MGYDLEIIPVRVPAGTVFPVEKAAATTILEQATPMDAQRVRGALLATKGCKPGPGDAVDYVGQGLSYARMTVTERAVHLDNNAGPRDLEAICQSLEAALGPVVIRDLQSGRLHTPESYRQWLSRPL